MNPSLAFVFPGQGSQQQGMLSDLAEKYDIIYDGWGTYYEHPYDSEEGDEPYDSDEE